MIEITPDNHALTLNSSIAKIHKKARLNGKLNAVDLYLLNVLYDLLYTCGLELTHEQRKKAEKVYRSIYNCSDDICKVTEIKGYTTKFESKFVVQEITDQNIIPVVAKVSYWQEPLGVDSTEILDLIATNTYVNTKPSKTKEEFLNGVDINYQDIGLIVFVINCNKESDQYEIFDYNGFDVTDAFNSFFDEDLELRIFISKNIYSYGIMEFKIKKI